jgi:hypothetical protein
MSLNLAVANSWVSSAPSYRRNRSDRVLRELDAALSDVHTHSTSQTTSSCQLDEQPTVAATHLQDRRAVEQRL